MGYYASSEEIRNGILGIRVREYEDSPRFVVSCKYQDGLWRVATQTDIHEYVKAWTKDLKKYLRD